MPKNVATKPVEKIEDGVNHCIRIKPYNMLVFDRIDGNNTPVYYVGGVEGGPWGAKNALKKAHEKHGGMCYYCKKTIIAAELSIDHVESKSIGGSGSLQNLVTCHKKCNNKKGTTPIEAFNPEAGREWLSALLQQVQARLNKISC